MERTVTGLLGGGLKPNDPRRFLIEAMIGVMNADGFADPREAQVIERQVASHPLFHGLTPATARTLIELSNDAIRFAGTAHRRAPVIARGLPARIHRLAAFGMAAEVAVADQQLVEGELQFLDELRRHLRISLLESEALIDSARAGYVAEYLEDRYRRIKTLVPVACEVFTLRARSRGVASDDERFRIRDFFAAIPDLAVAIDDLDGALFHAFRASHAQRAPDAQMFGELARVAATLPDPVDRYWMMVYTLVAEPPAAVASWRVSPFTGVLQGAFQIVDGDMEFAVIDAVAFPAAMPRPS